MFSVFALVLFYCTNYSINHFSHLWSTWFMCSVLMWLVLKNRTCKPGVVDICFRIWIIQKVGCSKLRVQTWTFRTWLSNVVIFRTLIFCNLDSPTHKCECAIHECFNCWKFQPNTEAGLRPAWITSPELEMCLWPRCCCNVPMLLHTCVAGRALRFALHKHIIVYAMAVCL